MYYIIMYICIVLYTSKLAASSSNYILQVLVIDYRFLSVDRKKSERDYAGFFLLPKSPVHYRQYIHFQFGNYMTTYTF